MRNIKILRRENCGMHTISIQQGEIERILRFLPATGSLDTENYINICHAEIGKLSALLAAAEADLADRDVVIEGVKKWAGPFKNIIIPEQYERGYKTAQDEARALLTPAPATEGGEE